MKVVDTFVPLRVPADRFDETLAYYERVQSERCALRLRHAPGIWTSPRSGRSCRSEDQTKRLPLLRSSSVVSVDSLQRWREHLVQQGASIRFEPADIPTGQDMHVENPDGALFEYVQLDANEVASANIAHQRPSSAVTGHHRRARSQTASTCRERSSRRLS